MRNQIYMTFWKNSKKISKYIQIISESVVGFTNSKMMFWYILQRWNDDDELKRASIPMTHLQFIFSPFIILFHSFKHSNKYCILLIFNFDLKLDKIWVNFHRKVLNGKCDQCKYYFVSSIHPFQFHSYSFRDILFHSSWNIFAQ